MSSADARSDEAEAAVELLDGFVDSGPSSPARTWPRWQTAVIVGGAIVVCVAVLSWSNARRAGVGQMHAVETHFADPFATEWTGLEASNGASATSYQRPPPMASIDRSCVGFGRLDWPERQRHPSVAHCVDPADAARLPAEGIAVLRESVAGAETWYVFMFGSELDRLEVDVEIDVEVGDPIVLAADRVFVGGPFAAILVPNGFERLSLVWHTSHGDRIRCGLARGPLDAQSCEP